MLQRHLRLRRIPGWLAPVVLLLAPGALRAQQPDSIPPLDSIIVEGAQRLTPAQVVTSTGLVLHQPTNYRDVQRAVTALFRTGQFDDVLVEQRTLPDGRFALVFQVRELPLLRSWEVRGSERISAGDARELVKLVVGRPLDRAEIRRGAARIDSLYKRQGFYAATVTPNVQPVPGGVEVVFQIAEGSRVALSQVEIDGNTSFTDKQLVAQMATKPEGFFWFQKGAYDEQKVETDKRELLPQWYADHGRIDFQVIGDTLLPDSLTGKATLRLKVEEGPVYRIGSFDMAGNQRFSSDELAAFYPFVRGVPAGKSAPEFDRGAWQAATDRLTNLYYNNGYIYAQVQPTEERRVAPDGTPVVDLRWNIREGSPATINKIEIVGNDVTHERVIREAIVLLPGEVFNRDKLVRSYQNVMNLGFFQQPMAPPDVRPTENGVDVDVVFRVEEKRTGNINFGASVGQGTGLGGFLGLEEPNLFGRGKRGRFQLQFGSNVRDFTVSYTDPSIKESRISGSVSLFDSQVRYTVADLGRLRRTGGSLQVGFPFLGSRYTRFFTSYSLQRNQYTDSPSNLQGSTLCASCTRSTLGVSLLRDTRVGLPFAVGGSMLNLSAEQNGGPLSGTGNYRKFDVEGRWYAPLGTLGASNQLGSGIQFVLGLTAKSGFILGDAGPFFQELYTMGGVQYGIPLRGYDEFCITPSGYKPGCGNSPTRDDFGKAFAAFTVEAGARISQSLYLSSFFDAGNLYRSARQYDPTRLFRGAGVGAALVSPLGPIGIDLGYGFDKVDATGKPNPGWQVHFRLGNFF